MLQAHMLLRPMDNLVLVPGQGWWGDMTTPPCITRHLHTTPRCKNGSISEPSRAKGGRVGPTLLCLPLQATSAVRSPAESTGNSRGSTTPQSPPFVHSCWPPLAVHTQHPPPPRSTSSRCLHSPHSGPTIAGIPEERKSAVYYLIV